MRRTRGVVPLDVSLSPGLESFRIVIVTFHGDREEITVECADCPGGPGWRRWAHHARNLLGFGVEPPGGGGHLHALSTAIFAITSSSILLYTTLPLLLHRAVRKVLVVLQEIMLPQSLWVLCLGALAARAQHSFDAVSSDAISISSGARSVLATSETVSNVLGMSGDVVPFTQSISTISGSIPTPAFTGSQFTYLSYDGQSMRISASLLTIPGENETSTSTSSSSSSQISGSSESAKLTQINGLPPGAAIGTASSTSTGLGPTNTAPCNGYPEFCSRRYSDITEVCAHNPAFSVPNNLGSNQALPITDQLNDGVRMRKLPPTLFPRTPPC